jgi:hypothetical protein
MHENNFFSLFKMTFKIHFCTESRFVKILWPNFYKNHVKQKVAILKIITNQFEIKFLKILIPSKNEF